LPRWITRPISIAVTGLDSEDTARTKRLLAGALWVSVFTTAISVYQMVAVLEAPIAGWIIACSWIGSLLVLLVMWRWPGSYPGVMHFVILVNTFVSAALIITFGGQLASGANSVWGLLGLIGGVVVFADWRATFWLVVYVLTSIVSTAIATRIEPLETLDNPEYLASFNLLVVVLFIYWIVFYYVRQRALLLEQSDSLLRNVLPDDIAKRLKASPGTIADGFDSASILFADVSGFTPMSADMSPHDLVSMLDELFTDIDAMVERRGLEKIKTIGDAYMVAAGVPRPRDDHAVAVCDLALEIRDHVASKRFNGESVQFRIGINSGPVVAGIIGRNKFSYDLWGDAVNTASRMESFGSAGAIQITESTMRLVDDLFVCEPRGLVDVKGKGPMPVWHLIGRRIDSLPAEESPVEERNG
jgi:guanylate cyclase